MSTLKNILFVTNNYHPYSGGVVTSIDGFAQTLREQGYRVTIATLDFLGASLATDYDVVRIPCPIRFTYKNNHMAIPWRPYNHLHKLIAELQPDIIHSHHPFLLGACALRCAHYYAIPIVFTYHTHYDHYLHYLPIDDRVSKPLVMHTVNNYCKQVNGVIVPSTFTKQKVSFLPEHKVQVIPSGLLPIFFQQKKGTKKLYNDKIHLVTVSRFTPEKNIYFLLDVIAQLPSSVFQFTLVGYGSELAALQQYAYTKLGLSPDVVRFVIQPSKSSLAHLYAQADLFLFASQSETQGLVILEALASGTPVIALQGPGQSDVIVQGYNGYLVMTQKEMAIKIQQIMDDISLYESLQRGAFETAQHYALPTVAEKLVTFYCSLMAN